MTLTLLVYPKLLNLKLLIMNSNKEKKVKKNYRINFRTKLFLLDRPISKLPSNRLPTKGNVIRYLQYLKTPKAHKFKPTGFQAGCKQGRGTSDLKCKNTECDSQQRCAASSVIDIWMAAGFENKILTGRAVKNQICNLNERYVALLRKNVWTQNSGNELPNSKLESFLEECDQLFDISVPGIIEKIRNDRILDETARDEDIEFYKDQKSARKMYIDLDKPDRNLEKTIKMQQFRQERKNRMQMKLNTEVVESCPSDDILAYSDKSDVDASGIDESSSDDSDVESLDRSFRRQSKSKGAGKPKVKYKLEQ